MAAALQSLQSPQAIHPIQDEYIRHREYSIAEQTYNNSHKPHKTHKTHMPKYYHYIPPHHQCQDIHFEDIVPLEKLLTLDDLERKIQLRRSQRAKSAIKNAVSSAAKSVTRSIPGTSSSKKKDKKCRKSAV